MLKMGRSTKPYFVMSDIVHKLTEKLGCSRQEASKIAESFFELIEEGICREDKVGLQIVNLFTIEKVHRKQRRGIDRFSEKGKVKELVVPEKNELKITLGKNLFDRLNPDYKEAVKSVRGGGKEKKAGKLGGSKLSSKK